MSYPYGGGGYPQQGGYPAQQPGYPAAGGGYPAAGGGYPQAQQPPMGMPQPGYPSAQQGYPSAGAGNLPYGVNPPDIGFGGASGAPPVAMPNPGTGGAYGQPTYGAPMNAGYNTQQPPAGYPAAQPGYPAAQPGYPAAQPGYPAAQPGYPAAQPGYPAAQPGYPASQPGYPAPAQPQGYSAGQPAYPAGGAGSQPPVAGYGTQNQPYGDLSNQIKDMSISGTKYKEPKGQGTVKPASPFNAERDSEVLRKAMKGLGTDEKAIIDILAYRTNEQRQQIKLMFKTMYGKDLIKDLKSELGGRFEDVVLALMVKPDEYDAAQLRKAIEGMGTDEECLIEILTTRSNKDIHNIKSAYKTLYKRDLEKDLTSDTSGHFRRLMVSLCAAGRQENQPVDMVKAKQDAQSLYSAGEARWGTDESRFNHILCSQSYAQLRAVFAEYQQISKRTVEKAIQSEMSGDLASGMLAIVKVVQNKSGYFAERLYKSMKGAGTNDRSLIRLVVTRSEVDMVQIKDAFHRTYGKTLENFIQGDTSGDYKRILLALVSNK